MLLAKGSVEGVSSRQKFMTVDEETTHFRCFASRFSLSTRNLKGEKQVRLTKTVTTKHLNNNKEEYSVLPSCHITLPKEQRE